MGERAELNVGASALTSTLHEMITGMTERAPVLDFGVINGDYSLSLNSYGCAIPKGEYNVCRQLLYDPSVPLTETYVDGEHSHPDAAPPGNHSHKVRLPKKMHWLKPGDKVLVGVVQNEFIVIDKVYNGEHLGEGEPEW